jgi:hypothetical protein
MKRYGRSTLHEFLGDCLVYRNLQTQDASLPGLKEVAQAVGLPSGRIPRKSEGDYARVILYLLQTAQAKRGVAQPLKRLLFVGDTRLLDSTAFGNLCLASGWPGLAFIGAEDSKPASVEVVAHESGQPLYLANRWAALADFAAYAPGHGMPVDETTAVVIDIDKTALGARGRNGQVIDRARVQAVQDTVAAVLGEAFDLAEFRKAYDLLNQPEFHPFTADNQDYLAYVCLALGSGLYRLDEVVDEVRAGRLKSFAQFIEVVEKKRTAISPELAAIHDSIYATVRAGDPTPFKDFRRNEYLRTICCFGSLEDDAPVENMLEEEILITQEVRQAALAWQAQGALLFGLSDKPDEAATPTAEQAKEGYLPIHQAETHAVGIGQI